MKGIKESIRRRKKGGKGGISGAMMDDDESSGRPFSSVSIYRYDGNQLRELEWPSR